MYYKCLPHGKDYLSSTLSLSSSTSNSSLFPSVLACHCYPTLPLSLLYDDPCLFSTTNPAPSAPLFLFSKQLLPSFIPMLPFILMPTHHVHRLIHHIPFNIVIIYAAAIPHHPYPVYILLPAYLFLFNNPFLICKTNRRMQ